MRLTPSQRSLRARIGAYALHATHDPRETTKNARAEFDATFVRRVDPDGVLTPAELSRRVQMARSEHFTRLAYLSARARSKSR